jgi:hypothetical protein
VIATLGRNEDLKASGQLERLLQQTPQAAPVTLAGAHSVTTTAAAGNRQRE